MLLGHQTRRRLHSHVTRARHRTHARTAAAATTRAASDPRVVRRSAGRRRKAARWRADAHQLTIWHETRCGVRRAGSAVEGGSGRASATASPVLMPGQSLKRDYIKPHAKARAATDNPKPVPEKRVGATQGPRAPWGHTRTLSVAPIRASGMGFGLAMAARAFACGRIRSLCRGCPGGWREEEGRERRGGALGRGGVGEGRDGCGGGGGEGDVCVWVRRCRDHPRAIEGSGSPPDAPMSSGDPSLGVRRWSSDHLLITNCRSSVLQRIRSASEWENGWDAMRSADGAGHPRGVLWRTAARATHTGAGESVLENVVRHLGSSNMTGRQQVHGLRSRQTWTRARMYRAIRRAGGAAQAYILRHGAKETRGPTAQQRSLAPRVGYFFQADPGGFLTRVCRRGGQPHLDHRVRQP